MRRPTLALLTAALLMVPPSSFAQDTKASRPAKAGDKVGFAEARTGEIPAGAAELITADTQRAIENGLEWLSKQQNADGSYGSGAYRGNVAVTSLAALAMMASGSSPGRGPYGAQIDKALQNVLDNTSPAGLVA